MKKENKLFNTYGTEEYVSVKKIILSGKLSGFIAAKSKEFYGGEYVQKFEKTLNQYFKTKYCVTVNSWTSGLIAAVAATNIQPGDEVLVPTWTMSATASAILHCNAIPVFVDIDEEDFNICIKDLEKKITKKTKAILAVDIFGYPSKINELKKIASRYKLKLIFDSAQSIGAKYKNKFAGTFGDVGGFSLNYHKHIHTGEGGIIFTSNKEIYNKLLMIRNHGEVVMNTNNKKLLSNNIGFNFRLGEIESALGIEQLKKLNKYVKYRQKTYKIFYNRLKNLKGLILPKFNNKIFEPSHYVIPLRLSDKLIKKNSRRKIIKKLKLYNVPGLAEGYMNLHKLSVYQNKIAFGLKGYPWRIFDTKNKIKYDKSICPIAEKLHNKTFIGFSIFSYHLTKKKINYICDSFEKVWNDLR